MRFVLFLPVITALNSVLGACSSTTEPYGAMQPSGTIEWSGETNGIAAVASADLYGSRDTVRIALIDSTRLVRVYLWYYRGPGPGEYQIMHLTHQDYPRGSAEAVLQLRGLEAPIQFRGTDGILRIDKLGKHSLRGSAEFKGWSIEQRRTVSVRLVFSAVGGLGP